MNKSIRALILSTAILAGGITLGSSPAEAGCRRTKIHGPFGSWTWGPKICTPDIRISPPGRIPESSSSCLAVMPSPAPTYKFRIKNNTKASVTYYLNGVKYKTRPGYYRWHTRTNHYTGRTECGFGTGSRRPVIKFDYIVGDGEYSRKTYTLYTDKYSRFQFNRGSNSRILRLNHYTKYPAIKVKK